jgi:hypothetical protein
LDVANIYKVTVIVDTFLSKLPIRQYKSVDLNRRHYGIRAVKRWIQGDCLGIQQSLDAGIENIPRVKDFLTVLLRLEQAASNKTTHKNNVNSLF